MIEDKHRERDTASATLEALLHAITNRLTEVTIAKVKGRQGRAGTRHWTQAGHPASTKALDPDTVVNPDQWRDQIQHAAIQVLGPAGVATGTALRKRLREGGVATQPSTQAPAQEQPPAEFMPPVSAPENDEDAHPIADYAIIRAVNWLAHAGAGKAAELRDRIGQAEQADVTRVATGGTPDGVNPIVAAIRTWQSGPDGDTGLASWARTRAEAASTAAVEGVKHGILTDLPLTVTVTRTWQTRRDDKVRHAHRLAQGQAVDGDQPFTVGGEQLRYPGDPLGSPGNVINCRCHAPFKVHVPAEPVLAGVKALFDPSKHPRDAHGQFATVGAVARVLDGTSEGASGRIVAASNGRVTLELDNGKRTTEDADKIVVTGHSARGETQARPSALPETLEAVAYGFDREETLADVAPFMLGGIGGRDAQGRRAEGANEPYAYFVNPDDAVEAKIAVCAALEEKMAAVPDAVLLEPDTVEALASSRWSSETADDGTEEFHPDPDGTFDPGDPAVRAAVRRDAVSRLVQQWSLTSNDHDANSLAIQQVIAQEFEINDAHDWPVDPDLQEQADQIVQAKRPLLTAFVHAQYDLTQERLEQAGIDSVNLYRGMRWDDPDEVPEWARGIEEAGSVEVPLRPASSFTANGDTAVHFAQHGAGSEARTGQFENDPATLVLSATVPRERILATARTGVGCLNEWEFVVLGGPGQFSAVGNGLAPDEPLSDEELATFPAGGLKDDEVLRALTLKPDDGRRRALHNRADALGIQLKSLPTGDTTGPTPADVLNEDWLRTLTWDVRDWDQRPITDLPTLAERLGVSAAAARTWLRTMPAGQAAPASLRGDRPVTEPKEAKIAAAGGPPDREHPFDSSRHPRGIHGRFAHSWLHIVHSVQRRDSSQVVADTLRAQDLEWGKYLDGYASDDGSYYIERRIAGNRLYAKADKGDDGAESIDGGPFAYGRLVGTGSITELRAKAADDHARELQSANRGSGDEPVRGDSGGQLAAGRAGSVRADRGQAGVLRDAGGAGAGADRHGSGPGGSEGPAGGDVRAADAAGAASAAGGGGDRGAGAPDSTGPGPRDVGSEQRTAAAAGGEPGGSAAAAGDGGLPASGDGADGAVEESPQPEPEPGQMPGAIGGEDFTPASMDDLAPAGKIAKLNANMAALRLLRELQRENRPATPEEQAVLARWAGWGGLPDVFDPSKERYAEARAELEHLMSPKEIREARRNTLNAHYTDARVVENVWRAVGELGFDGGRVLEPGSGSGTFIGMAPDSAAMVGVELDSTTAAISQFLYPSAVIRNESFAKTNVPDGSFDATIGNVPFGRFKLTDRRHNKAGESIHNHFILKSLALTRPGGIVAVLTSRYTLDSRNERARQAMADKADLIGAIRLPSGSHQRASETGVIEDVLFFRVRQPGEKPQADQSWVHARKQDIDGQSITVNDYWDEHPENVLGEVHAEAGQHGTGDMIVRGDRAMPDLPAVMGRLVAQARQEGLTATPSDHEPLPELVAANTSRHQGHLRAESDGSFTQARRGASVPVDVPTTQADELRQLIGLRDGLAALLTAEAGSKENTPQIDALRTDLNRRYDAYVAKFGAVNRFKLSKAGAQNRPPQGGFRSDPMSAIVRALEKFDAATQEAKKADVFTTRAVAPRELRTSADTPADALAISIEQYGDVNLPAIAKLLGTDEAAARDRLGNLVFEQPPLTDEEQAAAEAALTAERLGDIAVADAVDLSSVGESVRQAGALEPAAAYLSGNVRRKLAAAKAAATHDPRFRTNVDALERVLPADLGQDEIDGRLGAAWIGADTVQQFVGELLNDRSKTRVAHSGGSIWNVVAPRQGVLATQEWGTPDRPAPELIQALLEQRPILVTHVIRSSDGKTHTVKDLEATLAAQEKAQLISDRFAEWLWEDPDRARRLQTTYNDLLNAIVLRQYPPTEGREFPGMSEAWAAKILPHVKASAERIVQEPTVLLAHVVGAGKTATMVTGAMELRRLGLARKPAIVIPNHMLEQFSREFLEIYPQAKLLAAGTEDLKGDKRREFVARAATGDWDAVILTHEAFEKIPMSPEAKQAYIDREMQTLRDQLAAAQESGRNDTAQKRTVKKMEAAVLRAEEALNKLLDKDKDAGVSFEQTGIDYLMVDEAHEYSNLRTLSNIPSASADGSDMATDLHMKIEHLRANNASGRVVTFASGTPIRNTVTQEYIMQRYLRPDLLEDAGIHSFDQWAATFGDVVDEMELKPEGGGFRQTSRFARFRNVPELLRLFNVFADVKMADDLKLDTPDLKGGRAETITVPASDALIAYVRNLGERADDVRGGKVEPTEDNMLKISTDGRKAALSMELVGQAREPGKIDAAADRIARIYEANADRRYGDDPIPGSLQIVFCDMGTPKDSGKKTRSVDDSDYDWNAYDALKTELVARGVPAEKIAFIHHAKNDVQKAQMFAAARNGRISVLIGSSGKMGVGTNIQDRAVALHHLDAPWRPADVEQREGRIVRQGNLNPDVEIIRYVTEKSFDAYMWQTLERKAKFIQQIMRGKLDVREIEDIGDQAMSYAEVKALATGDPDMLERAKTDAALTKLQRLERAHARQQVNMRAELKRYDQAIPQWSADADAIDTAIAQRTDTRGDAFAATVGGQSYADRPKAGEAIVAALDDVNRRVGYSYNPEPQIIGQIGGHNLAVTIGYDNRRGGRVLRIGFAGVPGDVYEVSPYDLGKVSPSGVIARLENGLQAFEQRRDRLRTAIDTGHDEVRRINERLGQPFPHTAELAGLQARSQELKEKMQTDVRAEGIGPPAYVVRGLALSTQDAGRAKYQQETGDDVPADVELWRAEVPGKLPVWLAFVGEQYLAHSLDRVSLLDEVEWYRRHDMLPAAPG